MNPKTVALLIVLFAFAAAMLLTACSTLGLSFESEYGRFTYELPTTGRTLKDKYERHPQCAPGTVSGLVFNGLGYLHEHEKMVPICDGLSALSARGRGLCNNPT